MAAEDTQVAVAAPEEDLSQENLTGASCGKAPDAVSGCPDATPCWASWCGPCRASFPHLRKVYEANREKIEFISVSLDKNDSDWRKATDEEKLPWQQYCATPSFSRAIGKAYKITSIPTFLLIGPDGGIIFSGHDSNDLDAQLEKL